MALEQNHLHLELLKEDPLPFSHTDSVQLLNTVYKFKRGAPLKAYISRLTRVEDPQHTLAELLMLIKKTIIEEKMFDDRNPSVILCSEEMEVALDQKALHVTEVIGLVLNQIIEVPKPPKYASLEEASDEQVEDPVYQPKGVFHPETPPSSRTTCEETNPQMDKDTKFQLKPLFLSVIRSVDGADQNQTIFTYAEVTRLLSKYILAKRFLLFDPRNIMLALVRHDPLGAAFGVSAFHRSQINRLLRSQLIPFHKGIHLYKTTLPTTSSPRESGSSESSQCPTAPPPFLDDSLSGSREAPTRKDSCWDKEPEEGAAEGREEEETDSEEDGVTGDECNCSDSN